MLSSTAQRALNRLLALHGNSLAVYLHYAQPWMISEDACQTLQLIAEDQRLMADKFLEFIVQREGVPARGEFPMAFTSLHDLSFDFLLPKLIAGQRSEIAQIERCAAQLSDDPEARALAEEALGAAKGHLDSLVELAGEPAAV